MKTLLHWLAHPVLSSALAAIVLTGALYHDALSLPLFADDLLQIPWLQSISWAELWSTPSPYGYFRPLWYSLWRVWGLLAGGLRPLGLHALNLVAHALAAWLAGLLASRWISRPSARHAGLGAAHAAIACALFAVFPFAREAVAWPGAIYNPLVSAMAAGGVLAYDHARHTGRAWWMAPALACTVLAPLTYEAGLLVGPLLALVECVGWLFRRWHRRWTWWPLPFGGLSITMLLAWRALRGSGVTSFGLTPHDLQRNVGYLVQGLIYPVAPIAQSVAARTGLGAETCLWLMALPTLVILAWAGLRRSPAATCLGLGWVALNAIPPLVAMEAEWFSLAPRYLYMTAAGVAILWAAAIYGLLGGGSASSVTKVSRAPWRRALMAALLLLLVLALLAPAGCFIRSGMRLYRLAGDAIWAAVAAAGRHQPILLVNLPLRITPKVRVYPLGFEGVTPLPKRVTAEQLVFVHSGLHDAAMAVAFGIVAAEPPPGYTYELFGQPAGWEELASAARQAHTTYLAHYKPGGIELVEAGGPAGDGGPASEPLTRFGADLELLSASGRCDEHGRVQLTAVWRTPSTPATDATVFAHLLAADGTLVAQADGYPLLNMLPFWLWRPGESVRDVRSFAQVTAGDYTVRLGVWELATGEPWLAEGHAEGVVLIPVRCP